MRTLFDFSGFVPGQQVGGAVIDIFIQTPVSPSQGRSSQTVQINTVDLETLEAVAMVTEITGKW